MKLFMQTIKIKNSFLFLIYFLLCQYSNSFAFVEGTRDGGGGVGVRCQTRNEIKSSLELLDLHEASIRNQLIMHNPLTEETAIQLTVNLFANHFWNPDTVPLAEYKKILTTEIISHLFRGESFMDFETKKTVKVEFVEDLALSKDIGTYHISKNCQLEQIAYFVDDVESLKISKKRWKELNWVNKAALISHELIYLMDRREGLENLNVFNPKIITSEQTREFIGTLFSNEKLTSKSDSLPKLNQLLWCLGKRDNYNFDSHFWAYENTKGGLTLIWSTVFGLGSMYQIKTELPKSKLKYFEEQNETEFTILAPIEFVDEYINRPNLSIEFHKQKNLPISIGLWQMDGTDSIPLGFSQYIKCEYHK